MNRLDPLQVSVDSVLSSTRARRFIKEGKNAERRGELEEARSLYAAALAADPDSSQADWDLLQNPRSFPERRAIRTMLRTRLADLTWSSFQESKKHRGSTSVPRVFMYWGQGFASAPPIVKSSLRSARLHHAEAQLVLLDNDNIHDWVSFPDHVWDLRTNYRAAFSDVLRIELLANHGGIWIDATCYSTADLTDIYSSLVGPSGFFAFGKDKPGVISSWFLASEAHSYIACMMRDSMRLFWSVFDRPITYYYMHQIWLQLYRMDDRFARQADLIPDLGVDPRAINRAMLTEATAVDVNKLLAGSFVHKLTYKHAAELVTPRTVAAHMENLP